MGADPNLNYKKIIIGLIVFSFFHVLMDAFSEDDTTIPFYLRNQMKAKVYKDFVFLPEKSLPSWNSHYSIVINFTKNSLETRILKNIQTWEQLTAWVDQNVVVIHDITEDSFEIRSLSLDSLDGTKPYSYFWVNHVGFESLEQAQQAVQKNQLTHQSMNPENLLDSGEKIPEIPVPSMNREELELKTEPKLNPRRDYPIPNLDQHIQEINIPMTAMEDEANRIDYKAFGQASFKRTNYDFPREGHSGYYNDFGGFLVHQFVLRGFQFFEGGSTLDPYVEVDVSLAGNDEAYNNELKTNVGLSYYILKGIPGLINISWMKWMEEIRVFAIYKHKNYLRDELADVPRYDWSLGFSLYKDWGWSQPFDETPYRSLLDYLWIETYWSSQWNKTNFSIENYEKFNHVIELIVGSKIPLSHSLPPLMPYISGKISTADEGLFFQNRWETAAGIRYMPFHTSRFEIYEWLFGLKLFMEYANIQAYLNDDPEDDRPDWDFRAGFKIDLDRF